jgi:hypothetical protein
MKRAIQIKGRVSLPEDTLHRLFKIANKIVVPSSWTLGEVGSRAQPPWLLPLVEEALVRLNSQGSRKFRFLSKDSPAMREISAIAYGKGSVPTHTDHVSGLSLLTFLGGSLEDSDGCHLVAEGEFYAGGQMVTLNAGQSLVFDDSEPHSWMHNGYWFFACNALEKV